MHMGSSIANSDCLFPQKDEGDYVFQSSIRLSYDTPFVSIILGEPWH